MDAEKYITDHWLKNRVYTHLEWEKHQIRLRTCAEALPATPGARYIDVGCASGHSTAIMQRFRPGNWTGVDFSRSAIAAASKFFPTGMSFFYVPDPAHLGQLGTFDGVVCSEVLEHAGDDRGLAQILLWTTGPGGTLVATTPNKKISDPGHLRTYTEAQFRALFERPGVERQIEIQTKGQFFYLIVRKEKRIG